MTTVHAISNIKLEYAKALIKSRELFKRRRYLLLRQRTENKQVIDKEIVAHNIELQRITNELLPIFIDDDTYTHDAQRIVKGFGTTYEVVKVTDNTTFYKANTWRRELLDRINPIFRAPLLLLRVVSKAII